MGITTWDKFKTLTDSEKVYLVEMTAIEAADYTNTKTLYLATHAKAFTHFYNPIVKGVPRLRRALQETFYGRSLPSWGYLICAREDGYYLDPEQEVAIDDLLSGTWLIRDQALVIKYGGESLPYSEYQTIFTGRARRIVDWNNTQFRIEIIDLQHVLEEKPVNPNVVTSGANVPTDSVGKTKPVALGNCKNVKPVLIDASVYKYLAHDTGVCGYNTISAAYDNGKSVALTDNGDGTFTLSSAPSGEVTCDIQGGKFGSPAAYKNKIADISQGLLETCAGFSSSDIDSAYITACNTDIPYEVGLYLDEKTSVLDAIDQLISGIPMWFTFTRAGKFRIGEFKVPSGAADHKITTFDIIASTIKGESHKETLWRQIVRYDRNLTVIQEDRSDPSLSLATKAWLAHEWRETESSTSSIKNTYPLATEGDPLETCLTTLADAEAVAGKWITLLGTWRKAYSFAVKPLTLDFELHQVANLTYQSADLASGRFGLGSGVLFRIIGTEEDYLGNQVILDLWG